MGKVKETFSAAASRVVVQAEPPAPPPTGCCAHGCPMPAGIIRDGQRFCAVHLDVPDWSLFDQATAEIRKRMDLRHAINLLRSPGMRSDAEAMADARRLWPELSEECPHPYAMLVEAEHRMRIAALPAEDKPQRARLTEALQNAIKRVPT